MSQSAIALDNYLADDAARVSMGSSSTVTLPSPRATGIPGSHGDHLERGVRSADGNDRPQSRHLVGRGRRANRHWPLSDISGWAGHTLLDTLARDRPAQAAVQVAAGDNGQEGPSALASCVGDDEFPRRYVVDAALADVEAWIGTHTAAPSAPPAQRRQPRRKSGKSG